MGEKEGGLGGGGVRERSEPVAEEEKIPLWALDSQDRRLVLLPHYSCGKQQRFQ